MSKHPVLTYLLKRIGIYVITIWGSFTVAFVFFHLVPGDPIAAYVQSMEQRYAHSGFEETSMIAKKLKPLALAAAATLVCTVGAVASTTPEPTEADIAVTAETSEITMLESLGTVAVAEADEALRSVTIVPAGAQRVAARVPWRWTSSPLVSSLSSGVRTHPHSGQARVSSVSPRNE